MVKFLDTKFLVMNLLIFLLLISTAHAEIITVEAEDYYIMGDGPAENQFTAKEQAYELAKRAAAEKVGVYVESHTEVINSVLTKDKIITIAATVMEVTWHDFFLDTVNNKAIKITCKLKAKVDTDKIVVDKIAEKEKLVQTISDKDKQIQSLLEENQRLKNQYEKTVSENQKKQIQVKFDENRRQFLIAKYERDIDTFDFGTTINLNELMNTAQKLSEIDPQNSAVFRVTVYSYREQGQTKRAIEYCNNVIMSNSSPMLMIETYTQLGDIYYNEYDNRAEARKYVNQGIAIVKQQYTKAQIEEFVNGGNVEINALQLTGKSNIIKELYILKSEIEDTNPTFDAVSIMENMKYSVDRLYNIKYRTDW